MFPRSRLVAALGGSSLGLPVDYLFDQGSLASYTITDPAAPTIRIVPIYDLNDGAQKSEWFCVRSRHWAGKSPVFVVAKNKLWPAFDTDMWFGAWATSADTDSWTLFDTFSVGASDYQFSHSEAFPAGMIYVALWPMYPFARTQRKVAAWLANALVSDTASSTDGVISLSSAVTPDAYGRGISGLPYYAFKISSGAGTKNIAILACRQHAAESPGGFAFEAAIDWLLAGSDLANFLLDYFDFYVYPCLYPVNVINGHSRMLWEDYTKQPNGVWNTDGTYEFIDTYKDAMDTDTGGAIEAGIDFHSFSSSAVALGDVQDDTDAMIVAFRNRMLGLDAAYTLLEESLPNSLTAWWIGTLSARLALYAEHGMSKTKTIANWQTYGQNNMKTLAYLLADGQFTQNPGVGSREFNGTTDRIDWASVFNTAGSAITISAWVYFDVLDHSNYILCTHQAGNTGYATILLATSAGTISFNRNGTTTLQIGTANGSIATGAWKHVLLTHDGVMTTASSVHIYINGAEGSYQGAVNGAGEYAATGLWSIGGRAYDDLRNLDGHAAQIGVWNRVLNGTEIANLAAGYAPSLAAASGLQFYFKGNTADLSNEIGGADGTADGTSQVTGVGNGPGIIYP